MGDTNVIFRYKHTLPPKSPFETNMGLSKMVNQSMPMVGMFLRNKFIAWFALIQSFHYYLNADPDQENSSGSKNAMDQSPMMKVVLSIIGICVCYMNIALPQPDAPPLKPKAVEDAKVVAKSVEGAKST